MSHISLKDVAAKAGVSYPTVSKVLQGKGTVSPKTRTRILQAADALGYVPNAVARSLASQKTSTIGLVVSDFSDIALSQIFIGACREVDRHGLSIMVGNVDPTGEHGIRHLRALLEQRVDGIVLIAPHIEEEERIADILHGRVPMVSTHPLIHENISIVSTDSIFTAKTPTQHLIELGHSRIGTITGIASRSVTQRRLLGYRQALEAANIPYHPEWVEEGDWRMAGGYQAARRLLERAPDLTAIYVQNDTMAVGLLSSLRDLGIRVPDDCAVIGCDDIPLATYVYPSLTTIHIPFQDIGMTAVKLLLDLITQQVTEPQQIFLPTYLVSRNSSGRCINKHSSKH